MTAPRAASTDPAGSAGSRVRPGARARTTGSRRSTRPRHDALDLRIGRVVRERLGLPGLRPGQHDAVRAAAGGRDVLAVMPTGYGKSAVYQVAAALLDGPTVVVSPLLALQHDQVEHLARADVGEAAQASSAVGERVRHEAFDDLVSGALEFLFLAPEQLARDDTRAALAEAAPSLVVVDEAHCISSWGHDFRPDYLRLGALIDELGHPVVVALTATAAPPVRDEIVERLGLRDPLVLVLGFDRPNIELAVRCFDDADAKDGAVGDHAAVASADGSTGIVYVGTRSRAEQLAEALEARGVPAAAYHAGLGKARRAEVHDAFLAGDVRVVVATSAFGMGIDKPDVRFVLHADIAESLDAYAQEIGRAGRDGEPAEATVFYRSADLALRTYLGARSRTSAKTMRAVAAALVSAPEPPDEPDLAEAAGVSRRSVAAALGRFDDAGATERDPDGKVVLAADVVSADDMLALATEVDEARASLARSRLDMMRAYAETTACRRRHLLTYFGEHYEQDCGACDNCRSGRAARVSAAGADDAFPLGTFVEHPDWGHGEVMRNEAGRLTVLFEGAGYRTLSADLVHERDLLRVVAPG